MPTSSAHPSKARRGLLAGLLVLTVATTGLVVAAPASAATWAQSVIAEINKERASKGLPALHESSALDLAAQRHTLWMSRTNTLSHWLSAYEPDLGGRVTKAGFAWSALAENLGMTTSWPANITATLRVQQMMFAEGPGGGHYDNIVSTRYTYVGVNVLVDSTNHKTWLTIDFARPA